MDACPQITARELKEKKPSAVWKNRFPRWDNKADLNDSRLEHVTTDSGREFQRPILRIAN
ncbi:hypothetical protein E2C01_034046 [Portunus trituberculatus]|uniref:Uncharacterized protein n=1 Tax=Portunus trituberculatus TaxID=210409 RepID=A0A5B7F4L0_PORTR|nr:hypothetical protein [Portunus trituberculatus]